MRTSRPLTKSHNKKASSRPKGKMLSRKCATAPIKRFSSKGAKTFGLGLGVGLATALTTQNAAAKSYRRIPPVFNQQRYMNDRLDPPANHFFFNPMTDFPLDRKILLTENVPIGETGCFKQEDSLYGLGGAVTLAFDAKKWTNKTSNNEQTQSTWTEMQAVGNGSSSPDRPLRAAIASSGVPKSLVGQITVHGASYLFWNQSELPNFATKGEDLTGLTGEDAVVVGHCGPDDDTRYEYIPINKQNPHLVEKLFQSLELEDQIERIRHAANKTKFIKDHPLQGLALLNNIQEPLSWRTSLATLIINDTNEDRIKHRKQFIQDNPQLASQLLTDDQLRQIRSQLRDPAYDNLFLNTTLPLPVITPVHSYTGRANNENGDEEFDFSSLTTKEVFGNMGREMPLMSAAVLGVSDGVGGMISYGDKNNTKEMSHLLMRSVRHNLTSSPSTTARDLLGQAFTSVLRHNQINIGACTAAIGVLKPAPPEEPEDEFDDGRRLHLSAANLGDSTIFAFRPKHNHDLGTITYTPLAMAWPLSHTGNTGPFPPLQLTIFDYQDRPNLVKNTNAISDMSTSLSSSHFSTPSEPNSGPSGGANIFTSKSDYTKVLHGKIPLSDLFSHFNPSQAQARAINRFSEIPGDQPWMAQCFEGVTLRRGDVVCAMSDGISDNLLANKLSTPAELWEAVVSYVHPAIRAQHPATRNVRPFKQVPGKPLNHLSGPVLSKYNKIPTNDILAMTDKILSKIEDTQIPPYDPVKSAPYVSFETLPSNEVSIVLDQSQSPPTLVEQTYKNPPVSSLDEDEKRRLYQHVYLSTQGVRYHSTLSHDTESVIAGTLSSSMAGSLVRLSQRGVKLDDMTVSCAIIY